MGTVKDDLYAAFPLFNDENDVSFLMELLYFFPIDKIYVSVGSYDQYLYDLQKTVIDNYEDGNFQVSFFYAHLIFMSYVYYCVEKAYRFKPERMKDIFYPINSYRGRDDKPGIETYRSVYEFSKIPEKDIFKVFYIMGMEDQEINALSKYISTRDDYAHATGKGNISEEKLVQDVRNIKGNMRTLHKLFFPDLKELYVQFLLEYAGDTYDIVVDNIFDFMFENSLSLVDIEYLCSLGISGIRNENEAFKEKYRKIKKVHCAFIEYCIENDGIEPPETYSVLRDEAYLYYRYEGLAKEYVEKELGINEYICIKDGGEFPVYECVECGEDQFVYDQDAEKYHCFACGQEYSEDRIGFCSRCGRVMLENGSVVCRNCLENIMEE